MNLYYVVIVKLDTLLVNARAGSRSEPEAGVALVKKKERLDWGFSCLLAIIMNLGSIELDKCVIAL